MDEQELAAGQASSAEELAPAPSGYPPSTVGDGAEPWVPGPYKPATANMGGDYPPPYKPVHSNGFKSAVQEQLQPTKGSRFLFF